VCQLYYGKGIFGWAFYGVLKLMLKISEWQGKPNLNVLFNYNMPIRGYAKMTGGFVTMDMAKALTEMANGHRIKGTGHLIKAAANRKP
jgi:beta-glucosidase